MLLYEALELCRGASIEPCMTLVVAVPTGSNHVCGHVGSSILSRLQVLGRAESGSVLASCLTRLKHPAAAVEAVAKLGTKCGFSPLDQR